MSKSTTNERATIKSLNIDESAMRKCLDSNMDVETLLKSSITDIKNKTGLERAYLKELVCALVDTLYVDNDATALKEVSEGKNVRNEKFMQALYSRSSYKNMADFVNALHGLGVPKSTGVCLWDAGFRSVQRISRATDKYLIKCVIGIDKTTISELREKIPYMSEEEYLANMPLKATIVEETYEKSKVEAIPLSRLFLEPNSLKAFVNAGYSNLNNVASIDVLDALDKSMLTRDQIELLYISVREYCRTTRKKRYYSVAAIRKLYSRVNVWYSSLNRDKTTVTSYARLIDQVKYVTRYFIDVTSSCEERLVKTLPNFLLNKSEEEIDNLSNLLTTCESVEEIREQLELWVNSLRDMLSTIATYCEKYYVEQ